MLDIGRLFERHSTLDGVKPFVEVEVMEKECTDIVANFFDEGLNSKYAEGSLEERLNIVNGFYDDVKHSMGICAELEFVNKPPYELGSYSKSSDTISLNSKYLEDADCTSLLDTILHESRHAFQHRAIDNPKSVSVDDKTRESWNINITNYILPIWDFEAYENQPVEKDANEFAENVMINGLVNSNHLNESYYG